MLQTNKRISLINHVKSKECINLQFFSSLSNILVYFMYFFLFLFMFFNTLHKNLSYSMNFRRSLVIWFRLHRFSDLVWNGWSGVHLLLVQNGVNCTFPHRKQRLNEEQANETNEQQKRRSMRLLSFSAAISCGIRLCDGGCSECGVSVVRNFNVF